MTDEPKPRPSSVPAVRSSQLTRTNRPALPASGGAWFGSATTVLKKDAEYVDAHAHYLRARSDQSHAMAALIDSRLALARSIANLDQLPDIVAHDVARGKLDREHELAMLQLQTKTHQVQARTTLLQAEQVLATFQPAPAHHATRSPAAGGLTPAEIETIAQQIPEITPETLRTLALMMSGVIAEKTK